MTVIVVRDAKHKKQNKPLIPRGYEELFVTNAIKVIEWDPKTALDFAMKLLHKIKTSYPIAKNYTNSIKDTINSLTLKYPDLFAKRKRVQENTRCVELLKQIKERDPDFRFGEILQGALWQPAGCKSSIGKYLGSIEDKRFEKLLKKYLEDQKQR